PSHARRPVPPRQGTAAAPPRRPAPKASASRVVRLRLDMSSRKSKGERDAERGAGRANPHVALSRTESFNLDESPAAQIRRRAHSQPDIRSRRERAFLVGVEYHRRRGGEQSSVTSQAKIASQAARAQRTRDKPRAEADGDFDAAESIAELRELATSAGA